MVGLLDAPPGAFKPARGSALTFLAYQVRHAARRVRARYTAPGQPTRPSKAKVDTAGINNICMVSLASSREVDPEAVAALEVTARGTSDALRFGVARHVDNTTQV